MGVETSIFQPPSTLPNHKPGKTAQDHAESLLWHQNANCLLVQQAALQKLNRLTCSTPRGSGIRRHKPSGSLFFVLSCCRTLHRQDPEAESQNRGRGMMECERTVARTSPRFRQPRDARLGSSRHSCRETEIALVVYARYTYALSNRSTSYPTMTKERKQGSF